MNMQSKPGLSKEKIIQLIADILLIEIGLMVSSFGTALFYAGDIGSSAMATFSDGLHVLLNINYGNANTLANIVLLVLLFILDRRYINVGTILCVFTIGPWVNVFTPLLQSFELSSGNMLIRILCAIGGTALMGVGLGFYMAVDRGLGALEGIVKYAKEKTGASVRTAKIIQDSVLVIAGIALGAQWGIGTIIGIFCTGPVLQRANSFFGKYIVRLRKGI